ncbi:EVE domain-containing protein [Algoriphagus boritolerans]|uniref:Predicted RNA-binding protein, contains PUA-like domain n=1 Tax=Algoriphagus boritolerans DSM 17298 = JCM 18970 TaxID=1120964 RepID=A0A1H6AF67_9BACT|nr:EVE domain-containing protein [Algoriphagus boritolerans]SEG47022.1 Predicted RNA-binding protein, contains PUA-like domain [Algoriphagus boritolerans DSM 17298 = JCM 18970]
MNYWMVKTEPSSYSWEDFSEKGEDVWDGVRNYQARNFLKEMQQGDPVLFYHSGKDKAVVGVAEVSAAAFPDPKDEAWVAVGLKVKQALKNPVTLETIKAEDGLSEMLMLRQSRLSVMSVTKEEFNIILNLSK